MDFLNLLLDSSTTTSSPLFFFVGLLFDEQDEKVLHKIFMYNEIYLKNFFFFAIKFAGFQAKKIGAYIEFENFC